MNQYTSDDYASYNLTEEQQLLQQLDLKQIAKPQWYNTGKIWFRTRFFVTSIAAGNIVFHNSMRVRCWFHYWWKLSILK
jgi:hypothetical protein